MWRSIFGVSLLALAACGSDDGGAGNAPGMPTSSTPSPTPTPAPSPTPTPTPTPTPSVAEVTPFDQLIGTVTLNAASVTVWTEPSPPKFLGINAFGSGNSYRYNPQTQDISAIEPGGFTRPSFTVGDIDTSAPAGTIRYIKGNGEELIIQQPAPGGIGLRWTRFIEHSYVSGGTRDRITAITGVPTPISQIPSSGVVTFARSVVIGDAYLMDLSNNGKVTSLDLSPSTLTASVNYSTQRITFTLSLIGRAAGSGTNTTLVTLSGTTDFDSINPSIVATPATYANSAGFQIALALFGTSGAEAGAVFQYHGLSPEGTMILTVFGRLATTS